MHSLKFLRLVSGILAFLVSSMILLSPSAQADTISVSDAAVSAHSANTMDEANKVESDAEVASVASDATMTTQSVTIRDHLAGFQFTIPLNIDDLARINSTTQTHSGHIIGYTANIA